MSQSTERRSSYLLAFFVLLNVLNFVDRNLILGLSVPILEDLNLTYAQFGLLTGIIFTLFYTTVGVALGTIADRWNRPRLIAIGLLVWSAMTAGSGLARNFLHMAVARLFIGAGEATLTPTALSMLSDVLKPERRAFASGVYYMGVPVGTGIGLIIAGFLGPKIGWRNCFYLMGAIGTALVLAVLVVRDPPRGAMEDHLPEAGDGEVRTHSSFRATLGEFLTALGRSPALIFTILGAVAIHVALGSGAHDQLWFVKERGYTPSSAPMIFGTIFLLGGTLGTVTGGMLGDYCHKRWSGGRLLYLAVAGLIITPLIIGFRFVEPDTPLFYTMSFIACFNLTGFYGPVFSSVQDLSPLRVRSTAIAFLLFAVNFVGISSGAYGAGVLIDYFARIGIEEPLTWGIFLPSLIGVLAIPLFFLASRRYTSSIERMRADEALSPASDR